MLFLREKKIEKLREFSRYFLRIYNLASIGTSYVTPVNFHEEKEKFLASDTYNPQFYYVKRDVPDVSRVLIKLYHDLAVLKLPPELENYIEETIRSIENSLIAKAHIGTPDFA